MMNRLDLREPLVVPGIPACRRTKFLLHAETARADESRSIEPRSPALWQKLRLIAFLAIAAVSTSASAQTNSATGDRAYQVQVLTRIAEPVLASAAKGELKKTLPSHDWERDRKDYAGLEALGRTIAGISPWLELGPDNSPEGKVRTKFIELSVKAIANGVDPKSPDYLNFSRGGQPLVDAAFLAFGLLRAPNELWEKLDSEAKSNVITAFKATRSIKPPESNWLLFSAMVEAAIWEFTGECETNRIDYAIQRHEEWYLGDGTYGDGPEFHWDYYNSYVIQPMLLEVIRVCVEKKHPAGELQPKILARARRYAAVQERLISPEGTFPVIGRSSAYRFGALQHLSTIALLHELPPEAKPAATRGALTAVIHRMMDVPGVFDEHGWLQVGAVGHQPSIREGYISTGSLYLCLCGLADLGLPPTDPFWTAPAEPWTQKRIWAGDDIRADHAYSEHKK